MVTKNLVRTFDGLDQQTQHAYINKTMALAFMAYTFKDHIDNEGDGIKLGLIKAQLNNVVKRMVRRSERQPDGSFRVFQLVCGGGVLPYVLHLRGGVLWRLL